jgi:hypothetical protein
VEADYGMTEQAMQGENARYAHDDKLFVTFFKHPRKDEKATLAEGRPIYNDEDYVRIMVPGDKDSIVVRPARDLDKQRFSKQFTAYQAGEGESHQGTPLKAWPMVTRGQVEELKFFGVHTVEALAELADIHVQKFMGIGTLKEQAKAYIQQAKEAAPLVQLNAAIDDKDAEIAALNEAVNDLKSIVSDLQAESKPARKKKAS